MLDINASSASICFMTLGGTGEAMDNSNRARLANVLWGFSMGCWPAITLYNSRYTSLVAMVVQVTMAGMILVFSLFLWPLLF